ncbi:uncharacterized protein LOC117535882 isoform X2 [Gymnodraco acuticeps]|nr:uncharacterized protein LOC117535882 isoform X2 [Gymnodraco acuticeps]
MHTQVLKRQYLMAQPDSCIVTNAMTRTFQWRRKEVAEGVRADAIANKYPFLKTPAGLCEEMNRIHNIENLQHCFREEFLPKVLALAKGKSHLEKIYLQAGEESLSEDLPAMEFKAGLVLLPITFKEKVEHHVTLEEPGTPYPTTQLTHTDWKSAFTEDPVWSKRMGLSCAGPEIWKRESSQPFAHISFSTWPTHQTVRTP